MKLLSVLLSSVLAGPAAAGLWPDLTSSPRAAGGGEKDAAVIVGVENYAFVAPVPGARRNAQDWQAYLTGTLGVPSDKVTLLRDNEATLEKLRKYAAKAAVDVGPGGTLWFVFIGHGAPAKDGKDGILIGADAQQDADGLYARSLPRAELLGLLAKGAQAKAVVLLDACFSGRSSSGEAIVAGLQPLVLARDLGVLDRRTVLLTAAKSDQFAGPLPRSQPLRPAFSYLALGALRGWAADAQGRVTAGAVIEFARKALGLAKDRTQTPDLSAGASDAVLGLGREPAPDLAKIDREGAPSAGASFRISAPDLAAVPEGPKPLDAAAAGLDWSGVDVAVLEKYDAASKLDAGAASAQDKAQTWRKLAKSAPKLRALAEKRAAEWEGNAALRKELEVQKEKRLASRDGDWAKLGRLLKLGVVPEADKKTWAAQFAKAYADVPGLTPLMAFAAGGFLPQGAIFDKLRPLMEIGKTEQAALDAKRVDSDRALESFNALQRLYVCGVGGRKDAGCTLGETGVDANWHEVFSIDAWQDDADMRDPAVYASQYDSELKVPEAELKPTRLRSLGQVHFLVKGLKCVIGQRALLVGEAAGDGLADMKWYFRAYEAPRLFAGMDFWSRQRPGGDLLLSCNAGQGFDRRGDPNPGVRYQYFLLTYQNFGG